MDAQVAAGAAVTRGPLVSTAELAQQLGAWRLFDCRHDLMDHDAGGRAYREGHIPNAVFARIEDDLSGPKSTATGRHPLPARDALAATLGAWGIGSDTQIVAYDAHGGSFAGRLWWLARWLGHDRVAVLDGGWPAWLAATQWSSTADPEREPRTFAPRASLVPVLDAAQVLARLGDGRTLLLDARAAERFEGRVEPLDPVAGHIPGARNRFWQSNLQDGRFKAPSQLRAEFDALLAGRDVGALVNYCGSGVTAAHNVLAMQVAGLPATPLYAGSWSEWIRDPARPIATGAEPG
jgi:thiosulfate/3-mercaptopyruvate sulfurtransferase